MILSQLSRVVFCERCAVGDPGVDDQHLDRAVGRARFVERTRDLLSVGDIGLHRGAVDDVADEF